MVFAGRIYGIRVYEDNAEWWYRMSDIRDVMRCPKAKAAGRKRTVTDSYGYMREYKAQVITGDALLELARMYSTDIPLRTWRDAVESAAVMGSNECHSAAKA